MTEVHPTAIVSKKAHIESGVHIGPNSVIGDAVTIRRGTRILNNVTIDGMIEIGENNTIFSGAVIGSPPQDLKYKGEKSSLTIGMNNIIREFVTINSGTNHHPTIVGSNNLFMAYSHVAHDCTVGNGCIFANNATLAGHVTVHDEVVIGGLSAVHQFVRIGRLAIIGGCSKVVQDVPPYATCDGHPAKIYGINFVGLKRSQFSPEVIRQLRRAFKILFHSELAISSAVNKIKAEFVDISEELSCLLDFISTSKRGVSR